MKSLDTNILLYAADEDRREHDAAIRLVNDALRSPAEWMLADQVLFEMYAGLRHPGVFAKPSSEGHSGGFVFSETPFALMRPVTWPATIVPA